MSAVGRPLKNPELGARVPVCLKLPVKALARLRLLASRRNVSQADIVVNLLMQKPL